MIIIKEAASSRSSELTSRRETVSGIFRGVEIDSMKINEKRRSARE